MKNSYVERLKELPIFLDEISAMNFLPVEDNDLGGSLEENAWTFDEVDNLAVISVFHNRVEIWDQRMGDLFEYEFENEEWRILAVLKLEEIYRSTNMLRLASISRQVNAL